MTIKLVKYQNRNGGKVLLSQNCDIEIQECGALLKFPAPDNRKPSYAVLIDKDGVNDLVNKLLGFLVEED